MNSVSKTPHTFLETIIYYFLHGILGYECTEKSETHARRAPDLNHAMCVDTEDPELEVLLRHVTDEEKISQELSVCCGIFISSVRSTRKHQQESLKQHIPRRSSRW